MSGKFYHNQYNQIQKQLRDYSDRYFVKAVEILQEQGLSQSQIAKKLGVTQSTVSKKLKGGK